MSETIYSSPQSDLVVDYMSDENVKLWMAQALSMAERGKSALLITQFFKSKGVAADVATAAANALYESQSKKRFRLQLPFKIFGWFLIVFGTLCPIVLLLFGRGFVVVSVAPVALGFWIVFVLCNKRGAKLNFDA